jgi:REP element-mobilizing transposase RayT
MSQRVFAKIYLHIVWHTKQNLPSITPEIQEVIYSSVRKKCGQEGVFLFALGGIEDHLHFVVKIPPTILIAKWIGQLKGGSSFDVNQIVSGAEFAWQEGYGVVSFREKELGMVVDYTQNQREHHSSGRLYQNLERIYDDPLPEEPPSGGLGNLQPRP